MSSIKKTASGKYLARFRTPEGKSRCKTFDRKVDAERFLTSTDHRKLAGVYVDPGAGRRSFRDWWDTFAKTQVGLRPSTKARNDSYAVNHLLPHLGDLPLTSIDHAAAQAFVGTLVEKGLAPATVQKSVQLAGKAMRSAVKSRLITHDPFADLELPKVERVEMRFLTPSEVATLAEAIDPRYRALVVVGAYCGLRIGEMAALRRSRVDLVGRRLEVAETLVEVRGAIHVGPPKTRAGRRTVPIPRVAAAALEDAAAGLGPDEFVFPAPGGGALRAGLFRQRTWNPAVKTAGLAPLRIHDLRHTAVALWLEAGATPLEVAKRAGHSSVVTVLDRYGHRMPGSEDRVTDALDALAEAAAPTSSARVIPLAR